MTIHSVKRLDTHQTGPGTIADWTDELTDTYVVVASPGTSGAQIRQASKVPKMHTPHPTNAFALVVNVDPRQQTDEVWYVAVRWTTNPAEKNMGKDPMTDPLKYQWSEVRYEETRGEDFSDPPKAIADAAGTPFANPPRFPRSNLKLTITRNEPSYNMVQARKFANKVNEKPFWGQPAGDVKADVPLATEQERDGQPYWQVTYGFEFQEDGWNPVKIVNKGPRHFKPLVSSSGDVTEPENNKVIVVAHDGVGVSHNGLVFLKDTGYPLKIGDPHTFVEFTMYKEIDFGPLNLNQEDDPQLDPDA